MSDCIYIKKALYYRLMQKLTKIIATIGPVTDSPEMIEKLIRAGVSIFRFNFKHSSTEWHNERMIRVNQVAEKMGVSVGTLIDLQGPEIRINMPDDHIDIKIGDKLLFGESIFKRTSPDVKGFSISHPDIIKHLTEGQVIIADDGAFRFHVEKAGSEWYLISESKGTLKQRKSMNIPGADFPFPVLVDRDLEGLKLAIKGEVDFVALSFVRTSEDMRIVRREMKKFDMTAKLVSKIETQKALDDIDGIIDESDALMVARGDLGVELPIEQVPFHQKNLIKKCIEKGVPVITATQMLQSMIDNPYPTRAEVSDVANATYDLTDAVMLSGETASGAYPLETVEMMNKTVMFNENKILDDTRRRFNYPTKDQEEVICDAAYNVYLKSMDSFQAFVVFTKSGRTAQLVSRYRSKLPIIAITPSKIVADSLTIQYGVYPILTDYIPTENQDVMHGDIKESIKYLISKKILQHDKKIIVLHGDVWGTKGGTSTIKIMTV